MQKLTLPFLAGVILSALMIALLTSFSADLWEGWMPATCLERGCFCEATNTTNAIRQVANTLSSLGFVFSGIFMLAYKRTDAKRLSAFYSAIIGIAVIIIGLGSGFYHASLTFTGQFTDVLGMFLLAAFMLVYAWERIYKFQPRRTLGIYLAINVGLTWLQIVVPETRRFIFALVLIIALIFEAVYRRKAQPRITVRWIHLASGLMILAYIIWILDNLRVVCFENSILQGHALWHLLGAVSVWYLHKYYVSEEIITAGNAQTASLAERS